MQRVNWTTNQEYIDLFNEKLVEIKDLISKLDIDSAEAENITKALNDLETIYANLTLQAELV